MSISGPFTITSALSNGPTLSLGAIGSSSINLFGYGDAVSDKVKKYQMYDVGEDSLTLSVTWNRLRSNGISRTQRLLDGTLFDVIINEDRETAAKIRDFYSKKLMMLRLKSDKPMTNYREDLNKFIHSDGCTLREDMIGVVYRLPDFYKFDTQLEEITSSVNKKIRRASGDTTSTFTPLKRIERKTRSTNLVQYWMKDQNTGNGAVVSVQSNNPLEGVWNKIFKETDNLQLYYTPKYRSLDGFEYIELSKWGLS
jgi:hypothetical protein